MTLVITEVQVTLKLKVTTNIYIFCIFFIYLKITCSALCVRVCLSLVISKEVAEPLNGPLGESDLPSFCLGSCVLIGLEFGVII